MGILFNEFELRIDINDYIIFKRNTKKQVIDYVIDVLKESNRPLTVYEIFDIVNKQNPSITKSAEALRGSCQRDMNLIYFGRSSTYGLKVWEKNNEIKGGTIRSIVEEYLRLEKSPKHIVEITDYVNNYRNTNARNILTNLRVDESGIFTFFNQSFVGLAEHRNSKEYAYYENIPKFLGKDIAAEVRSAKGILVKDIAKIFSSRISIQESHMELIIRNLINDNFLYLDNNLIYATNEYKRN